MKTSKIIAASVFFIALCVDTASFTSVLNTSAVNIEEITSFLIVLSFLSVFLLTPVIGTHSLARFFVPGMKRNEKVKNSIVFIISVFTAFFAVSLGIMRGLPELYSLYLTYHRISISDALVTGMPVLMLLACIIASCILMFNIKIRKKNSKVKKTKKENKKAFYVKKIRSFVFRDRRTHYTKGGS